MAKDDMHVIIYKLLSYLYECMKKGSAVDVELLNNKMFLEVEIPFSYWYKILLELKRLEYIRGISLSNGKIVTMNKIEITFKGVEYLSSDDFIRKVAKEINE
ncbi:MAG: YjcQ family protein [Candidatus Alectryocaccobium sp.]|jgi:hypothetical protein